MNHPLFIVFEGGEGSGKTTQAKMLAAFLRSKNKKVFLTKEPGGDDPVCKDIRKILLNPDYKGKFSYRTELFLFEADRAQHVDYVVKPALTALERGEIVISDRYEASTYAYQCGGRNVCSDQKFYDINSFATGGLQPNFCFYLDIDPEIGLLRKKEENVETRFEKETLDFHQRVREGFLEYFKDVPSDRWQQFDASLSIEELHDLIIYYMKKLGIV